MSKPSTKAKIAVVTIAAVLLIATLVSLPVASELSRISKVIEQYRLHDAVHTEISADPFRRPSVMYMIDPPFMKRYGLDSSNKENFNAEGHFLPTGIHWAKWSLETKTAAVMMWRTRTDFSAWQMRRTIRLVDDYYSLNEQTTPRRVKKLKPTDIQRFRGR